MTDVLSPTRAAAGPAPQRQPKGGRPARPLPLAGVRVLDVSQVMAGPFTCMLLGDLGADVIKIEPPGAGDQTRSAMGFRLKGADSMGFLNLNRNKRSVALNLKSEAGREVFYKLAAGADIVVENYRPGVMRRLKCDYESVAKINPRIVYASISGFGQTGPWAMRPGFDLMAQAMSGIMSVTGHPGGPPVKAGVPVADIGCGLFAAYAVLGAYIGAKETGEGQYIDASLFEAALAFSVWDICEYWGRGILPGPVGTSNRMSAPYQAVKSRDGYFVMGAANQKLWVQLCELMGRPDLLQDERFKDNPGRLTHREALIESLEQTFVTRTSDEWVEALLAAGIPAGTMLTYPEAFEGEQGQARDMRLTIQHPVEGEIPNIGFPVKLNGTPQQVRLPPPLLGEHTSAVLAEIGIAGGDLDALAERGAFA